MSEPSLERLAQRHGSDKAEHGYCPFYEDLLATRRPEPVRVLELGVGGFDRPDDPTWGGASLRMWKDYFAHGTVWGLDILDKSGVAEDRVTVVRGGQADADLLQRLSLQDGPFDLIVDDASHLPSLTIASFEILFPLLAPGGVYVIEDVATSYWPLWGGRLRPGSGRSTMGLVKARLDGLNHAEFKLPRYRPSALDRSIVEVRARHDIVAFVKGDNTAPSTLNHPHPVGVVEWGRVDALPAAVSWARRPSVLRALDALGMRSWFQRARRRLVPRVDR